MLDTSCCLGQNLRARQIVAEQSREIRRKYNGREVFNGVIQRWERASSFHAASAAKQNVDVDRTDSCQCCGLLWYWSLHAAQSLKTL